MRAGLVRVKYWWNFPNFEENPPLTKKVCHTPHSKGLLFLGPQGKTKSPANPFIFRVNQPLDDPAEVRRQAYSRLLAAVDVRLQLFILSMVPHWADAMEIAQDVRLTLWEQFDDYDSSKDFGAWACTVARYRVMTFRKKSLREQAKFSDEFIDVVSAEATKVTGSDDVRREALLQCLNSLLPAQKELLVQHYAHSQTLKSIATKMGESFDSVRQRVVRIRKKLSLCIEKRLRAMEER